MKKVLLILFALFSTASLFAQQKPFDIEHAPAPLFRCPIYDGPTDPTLEWNEERQEWWMFLYATSGQRREFTRSC